MGWSMQTSRIGGVIALAWLLVAAHAANAKSLCEEDDKTCQQRAYVSHPIRLLSSWEADLSKPLPQRIKPASDSLVGYLTLDNQLHGFSERPRTARPSASFLADVNAVFKELPPQVMQLLQSRLAGVQLVEDLGSTGYTNYVYDAQRKVVAAFVVLDAGVLQRMTANQWATWKESTPFKPQNGFLLKAKIEEAASDNLKNSLQYILLHELAHVISVGRPLHPQWDIAPKASPTGMKYPYFDASWTADATTDQYRSRFDASFVQRKDIVYYGTPRLTASDMVPTYSNLERTNFPTLYAATKPADDFAEGFANYLHVVIFKRPWQITLLKGGQVVKVIKPCWEEARCAEKRKIIEDLLKSAHY
jgi:hypothetical protein